MASVRRLLYFLEIVVNIYDQGEENVELEELRRKLIEGTIQVIARDGLGETTTKKIRLASSVNEAYIYRCFKDKEDLFAKTFAFLDEELLDITMQHIEVMYAEEKTFIERGRAYFTKVWELLLRNRDKCLA